MSIEVASNMKNIALATSILATTLLAAGGVQAQGFGGSYAAVFLGDHTNGSPGALSYGGVMGHNIALGSAVVGSIEEELSFDPKSGWGSGTAVSGTVSARAGYDLGPALVFGKLGVGYSSVNTGYWVLGAGVDYDLSGRAFLRAEIDSLDPSKSGLSTANVIKLGLGWKF